MGLCNIFVGTLLYICNYLAVSGISETTQHCDHTKLIGKFQFLKLERKWMNVLRSKCLNPTRR